MHTNRNDSKLGDVPEYDNLPDPGTICAHHGEDRTLNRGAVTPPIFQNSLFTFPTCEDRGKKWLSPDQDTYDYTRVWTWCMRHHTECIGQSEHELWRKVHRL